MRFTLRASSLCFIALLFPVTGQIRRVPPGGAPLKGSGTVQVGGYIRVIDGDTIEAIINGRRAGIGLLGIKAPEVNTPCGKTAAHALSTLIGYSGVTLDEELDHTFDSRRRRLYGVRVKSRHLALELVRAGLARPSGTSRDIGALLQAEAQARAGKRGCLWGATGVPPGPSGIHATEPLAPQRTNREVTPQGKSSGINVAAAADARIASFTSAFTYDVAATGLSIPTAFAMLPDGRILIAEQAGVVRVYKNGALLPTPLIDLRDRVNAYWDRGLIGLAADPNFATNGFVYLYYTYENDQAEYSGPKTARLTRVTAAGDTASLSTETVLIGTQVARSCNDLPAGSDCIPSDSPSHSAGNIRFAADGTMFVTVGDGASFNVVDDDALRAQDVDSLSGKVLRVTPTGLGLASNPYWNGSATANRSKVFARGVRNSFRFTIRPGTTTPFAGEVGWGTYDEINVVTSGANLGWPCYEGTARQGGYESKAVCQALYAQPAAVKAPLIEVPHNGQSAAIVGGDFYSGSLYPAEYRGALFYGDYALGTMHYLKVDANNNLTGGPFVFATDVDGPVEIQMGSDQNLYYAAINTGELQRVRYLGSPDSIRPNIIATSPSTDAANVGPSTAIAVTFSEQMDQSTVTSSTITLRNETSGSTEPATITYDGNARRAIITPSTGLLYGRTYRVTVKSGIVGVRDLAGNPLLADYSWTFAVVALPPSGTSYLSDLQWTSMTNGWGPAEKDRSNGETALGDGRPLSIGSATYTKGIGVHAPSELRFHLGGACSTFQAEVGVDEEVNTSGSVVFQVWADGLKLFDSGLRTGSDPALSATADLTGRNELSLVVTDGDDTASSDHADWAQARITCSNSSDTTPPAVTSRTPAPGSTGVGNTTSIKAGFSEALDPSTVSAATFQVTPAGDTRAVAATVTYDAVSRTATLLPAPALATGTLYTAVLSGGANGIKDLAGNPIPADVSWTFRTSAASPTYTYLSDMQPTLAVNGWGPAEMDKSNGDSGAGDGNPIRIENVTYTKGIGVHARSEIRYNLSRNCTTFVADIGIDDEVGAFGSVTFQVWADGSQLFTSGAITGFMPSQPVVVDVTARQELRLIVDGGSDISSDHADWANARVACTGGNQKPTATIGAPSQTLTYKVGDTIAFNGSATDQEDGIITGAGLSWTVRIHHCPGGDCHIHPFLTATGPSGNFTVPDHGDDSFFEIELTARDSGGLSDVRTVTLQPQIVAVTIDSEPAGLQVGYGELSGTAPLIRNAIVGSSQSIYTTTPQPGYSFVSWSDGGAIQHTITVGTAPAQYVARFNETTPPTITGRSPAPNATGVAITAAVSATFSEEMTASTLNSTSFTLVKQVSGTVVAAAVSYSATTRTATLQPGAALESGTGYVVTVKGGPSGAKDSTGNPLAADVSWTFTTVPGSSETTRYLSEMTWTHVSNGYGPVELNRSNGGNAAGDGTTLTLNSVTYPKGLGVHAASDVRYALGGACTTFAAKIGVDDEVGESVGSVVFEIWADGTRLHASDILTGSAATVPVSVNVTGRNELRLVVTDAGNGSAYDHADWADAKLTCSATGDVTAPTISARAPASGATSVARNAPVIVTFSEPMNASTLTTGTISLKRQGSSTSIAATVTYDPTTRSATLQPSANLAANTQHVVTVKGGPTGVKDLAGNPLAADQTWTFTTGATAVVVRYLSDLTWTSATNGFGPVEKNRSNGGSAAGDGQTITLQSVTYAKGLGTHANSDVRFNLGTGCTTFEADIGIDDEVGLSGSVRFHVYGNSTLLYSSPVMTGATATVALRLTITGLSQLRLVVDSGGDNLNSDHSDWANARLTCNQ